MSFRLLFLSFIGNLWCTYGRWFTTTHTRDFIGGINHFRFTAWVALIIGDSCCEILVHFDCEGIGHNPSSPVETERKSVVACVCIVASSCILVNKSFHFIEINRFHRIVIRWDVSGSLLGPSIIHERMAFFGTFAALCGLKRTGRDDLAMKMIKDDGRWLRMMREGAEVTFEAWGKDLKWNTSLFHLCYTYPVLFLCDWGMEKLFV